MTLGLKHLLKEYEESNKKCDKSYKEQQDAELEHRNNKSDNLQISKAILEEIGFDTNNFHGGLYNFTDEILPFLKKVCDE